MHKVVLYLLLLVGVTAALISCGGSGSSSPPPSSNPIFGNPERVTILGYSGDVMEPFVSRDGAALFFNDNGADKDIYYATAIGPTTFQFQGAISAISTPAVEGVPSMDSANRFYYVSTANYSPPTSYDTLYGGTWTGSTVTGSAPVTGLAIETPGFINFDLDISPDGSTLYFADGDFTGGNNFPNAADIVIAVDEGGAFVRHTDSAAIMANVNTADLEYAPAISADGLELYFTRLNLSTMEARIYGTIRPSLNSPFAAPRLVGAIESFAEGPAFSPDENSLYYHKLNTGTGVFELYRVTRP